jgi:hypothetical protein
MTAVFIYLPNNEAVVEKLDLMLRAHHPFASAYKKAHDIYQEAKEDAQRQGKEARKYFIEITRLDPV